jgi:hypothetical protein
MAASIFIPSDPSSRLAPVIPLRRHVGATLRRSAPQIAPQVEVEAGSPSLRLVEARPGRGPARRAVHLIAALLTLVLLTGLALGVASASSAEPGVGGHVVLQPGETLWDVAVRSAPPGVDARRQLADIRQLNELGGGPIAAWTVVLLPA